MGKQLKYQTKEELMLTAKANDVKGLKTTMTKAEMISLLEAKPKAEEKKASTGRRGEYYGR